jgi:1-acyl-sn-glycerol-3-phosphate acyltransferase
MAAGNRHSHSLARAATGKNAPVRRVVSIPIVVVALFVGLPLAPLILLVGTVVDFAKRRPNLPTVRVLTFGYQILVLEVCAIVSALALWVGFGFGFGLRSQRSLRAHGRVQSWWIGQVAAAARRSAHLVFDGPESEPLAGDRRVVVLARHASYADAILPAVLFGSQRKMPLRYVLADELTWDPALGLYGRRLPNVFVNRQRRGDDTQLDAIRSLGAGLEPNGAAIIFPEGQFLTAERRERAIARLAETDPVLADRAATLRHLLPPRPAGTLALLETATDADVVVIGNVGLEGFGRLRDIAQRLPIDAPVKVGAWRIAAAEIPTEHAARVEWLWQQWERLDAWIGEHTPSITDSITKGSA